MNLLKFRYLQNNAIAFLLLFYNTNFALWELNSWLWSHSMLYVKQTIKYFYNEGYFHSHNNVWPREKHNLKQ
jgi:hypothetical protein